MNAAEQRSPAERKTRKFPGFSVTFHSVIRFPDEISPPSFPRRAFVPLFSGAGFFINGLKPGNSGAQTISRPASKGKKYS